jgi:hypothetical protein
MVKVMKDTRNIKTILKWGTKSKAGHEERMMKG